MSSSKTSMIRQIDDSTDRWKIVARVIRRWNVYEKDSPADLLCISMLLIDEEGTRIQASVSNKSAFKLFEDKALEGRSYFIANFSVVGNTKEYRATKHPFKITLGKHTYVKEREADIPEYSYNFFPISEIIEITDKKSVDYLIDVIGFVTSVGPLEEYRNDSEMKNRMRLTLSDNLENSVSCVLLDECATEVCMMDFTKMDAPVVMLMQLARIGFDAKGKPEVCSSFHASKVLFNMNYPEVKHFIKSAKSLPSPTISTISASVSSKASNTVESSVIQNQPFIPIVDIAKQTMGEYFWIRCKVIKVDTRHGWKYIGCSKCGSKPKDDDVKQPCMGNLCKKKPTTYESKLRVHYTVMDESGKISVVFFDKLAIQFIGKTAAELEKGLPKDKDGYIDVPGELDFLVGKRLLLKMKLNQYNVDFPHSSISVATYTEVADLMDEFNRAGKAIEEVADEGSDYVVMQEDFAQDSYLSQTEPCMMEDVDVVKVDLDEIPVSEMMPVATYKGKRKSIARRIGGGSSKGLSVSNDSPIKFGGKI
ncbi:replication factor A protein 1-like [Neltuma alba]|uniref:replication factor A protein 1-like n=1 Tax=Neltuma alba TaxID=207710 RepID=UPI0010A2C5A6|nr:replication factor A protein 1-like [Prosopis alba]